MKEPFSPPPASVLRGRQSSEKSHLKIEGEVDEIDRPNLPPHPIPQPLSLDPRLPFPPEPHRSPQGMLLQLGFQVYRLLPRSALKNIPSTTQCDRARTHPLIQVSPNMANKPARS